MPQRHRGRASDYQRITALRSPWWRAAGPERRPGAECSATTVLPVAAGGGKSALPRADQRDRRRGGRPGRLEVLPLSGVRDRRPDPQFGMEANRMKIPFRRQHGVALPVMMIILTVMLVSSVYLFKASNSTTMTTSNLAYEASLSKAADLGLHAGFQWISDTARAAKVKLDKDDAANGYRATWTPPLSTSALNFWVGAVTIDDTASNRIGTWCTHARSTAPTTARRTAACRPPPTPLRWAPRWPSATAWRPIRPVMPAPRRSIT
jgi:hypothetical protein